MYIAEKYWNHYIGDTDDSLTLIEYLAEKGKKEIPLCEIFSDFGLDKIEENFRRPDIPLVFTNSEGWEISIDYAIDLITDVAALLLECKISGSVDLHELNDEEGEEPDLIQITATPEEHRLIDEILADFAASPLEYDLSEMVPEDDMTEMAQICESLRKELYG